ncbi:hypothetical protein [Alicyclobacillus sendaiensis]|uniref:hypothetical protein n=1 Tax=Alicyclobacillus sendaiensis TaxID=192387 RepID=UPI00078524F8|nr:hypothetical protein [Alicyclobacillus sendaiensis]
MSMNIMKWEKMSSPYSEDAWMEFAQKGDFRQAIWMYVLKHVGTSFAELQRHFRTYIPVDGEYGLTIAPNNFLWFGMSKAFAVYLLDLIQRRQLFIFVPDRSQRGWVVLNYVVDGDVLTIPYSNHFGAYKRPHWSPCVLNVLPDDSARLRALNSKVEMCRFTG